MRPLLILTIVFAMIASTAQSQDNFNVTKVGGYLAGRDVKDIVISGDYAFCADDYGLSVCDLSEPENPNEIARRPTPSLAWSVGIYENYAYIGDYWRGLSIFDTSDPTNPQLVNEVGINFRAANTLYRLKVYIHDGILYYLSSVMGLFVYSLEDPENPELIESYSEGSNYVDIDVRENLAYITCFYPGVLLILNVSEPTDIELVNEIEIENDSRACDIRGEILALVTDRSRGLKLYSLEDPSNPQFISQCESSRSASVILTDDFALSLMLTSNRVSHPNLQIIDITNINEPTIIGEAAEIGGDAMSLSGNYVFTASYGEGLRSISIENLDDLEVLNEPLDYHSYITTDISEGVAYTQDNWRGLNIIDIADLRSPHLISEWVRDRLNYDNFIPRSTLKIDDYIYTGVFYSVSLIDVSNIENPERVEDFFLFYWGINTVNKMYLLGDYLYVTGRFRDADDVDDYMNLYVFNVENPGQPEVAFQRRELDFGMGYSSLDNNILYQVAKDNPGSGDHYVLIYDVEDPSRPRYRGRWQSGIYETMLVHNQVAYIYFDDAINVYTVEDPMDPELIESLQIDRKITDMCIDGDVIYLSADIFGFYCMSIADPTDPEIVGYYDTPGTVYQCQGIDGYLYVCDDYELGIYDCAEIHGIWNIELSTESHNFGEVHLNTDSTFQLTISNLALQSVGILDVSTDSLAFTVDFDSVFTIEPDSEAIVEVTFTPTEQRHYNGTLTIHTERRDLIVDLSGAGVDLSVTDEDLMPLEFGLYPAYPNPFNSTTTIKYGLDKSAPTRIAIYDLSGREVVCLVNKKQSAGRYQITWDAEGRPSGMYLLRLKVENRERVTKLILIR